jgi:cytochrome bd-type quinol oxidase subunit 2
VGQWLKGRIYERRSDLSPDGKHLIYFAMNGLNMKGLLMNRSLCTIAVVAHLLVTFFHGSAHAGLGVGLTTWQNWYVAIVIMIAPQVALILIWTRHHRLGLLLLVLSMAGSVIFGTYFHYVFISPDHVSYLPPGEAQSMFRLTALLLVITELFALVLGLLGLRTAVKIGVTEQVELPPASSRKASGGT